VQPIALHLPYLHLPSLRAHRVYAKKLPTLPKSGLVFNRAAVEASLRRARALWGRLRQTDYPHGAMIFCSEDIAEVVHPLHPLQGRVYSCGQHFDTSILRAQVEAENAPPFGLIVLDGSDACIGSARGIGSTACDVSMLSHVSSTAGSSTRRGGQSALRYSRLRDEADLAFLRRVVERAEKLLHQARGVILAGKADTKHRLFQELSPSFKARVLCTLDLPCSAGLDGLRLAASRAVSAVAASSQGKIEKQLSNFMELLELPVSESGGLSVCYGHSQTLAALHLGAVETLLVAEGNDEATWKHLAALHATHVVRVPALSPQGVQFCSSFGVGGCLRWPVDPDLLEEKEEPEVHVFDDDDSICAETIYAGSEPRFEKRISPVPSEAPTFANSDTASLTDAEMGAEAMKVCEAHTSDSIHSWLKDVLTHALDNEASAESLAVCVGVVLEDDSTDINEALGQVKEMLLGEQVPLDIIDELARRVHQD